MIRIYIDHWEDYESIGDKAMLLNAMRRLEIYLGPCIFVTPYSPKKDGSFLYPNMITVTPPVNELTKTASWLRSLYTMANRLFHLLFPMASEKSIEFIHWAERIITIKYFLYTIGFHFIFSRPFRTFLDEIKKCDVFFTVGDCSLSDYWLDGVKLKTWLIQTIRPHVPICVLSSQGIGPLTAPWARHCLVEGLKKLDILSFRDYSYSKALVEAEGLSGVPNKIVGDEAFSFPSCDPRIAWNVLESAGIPEGKPFIAVNFRNTDFTQSTTFLLDKIAELMDQVISTTHRSIVFVCMSKGTHYGHDQEAGKRIKGVMKKSNRFHVLEPLDDIELVKGIIGQAIYTIGISYHLHVFSLSQGHPTIALYTGDYYKTKLDGLIAFYGKPSRSINFLEAGIEQTMNYISDLENQYTDACSHIRGVNGQIIKDNDWTIQMVRQLLINKGRLLDNDVTEGY